MIKRLYWARKIDAYQKEGGICPTEAERNSITPPHFARKTNRKFILISDIHPIDSAFEANISETKWRQHARL